MDGQMLEKIFIMRALEVLHPNDSPKLFARRKMGGFVVNQTSELLSSVLKCLENGYVLSRLGEGPKPFGHCNNSELRVHREPQTRITLPGSREQCFRRERKSSAGESAVTANTGW